MSKVGNPCPTLGQLLANRILHALLVGENSIARLKFMSLELITKQRGKVAMWCVLILRWVSVLG